jgi:hypothetical protein
MIITSHAKSIMLHGTFVPSVAAPSLSNAYCFSYKVPVAGGGRAAGVFLTARASRRSQILTTIMPDPRGFALRFHLQEKDRRCVRTEIIVLHMPSLAGRGKTLILSSLAFLSHMLMCIAL